MSLPTFQRIQITRPFQFVTNVQLNRPEKRNAFDPIFWKEIGEAFNFLATDSETRVIILSGNGPIFCAGIDLNSSEDLLNPESDGEDFARRARKMREKIIFFQNSLQAIENCPKPVIAAIHKACFGGGVDVIAACDIRVAVDGTAFSVKVIHKFDGLTVYCLQNFCDFGTRKTGSWDKNLCKSTVSCYFL